MNLKRYCINDFKSMDKIGFCEFVHIVCYKTTYIYGIVLLLCMLGMGACADENLSLNTTRGQILYEAEFQPMVSTRTLADTRHFGSLDHQSWSVDVSSINSVPYTRGLVVDDATDFNLIDEDFGFGAFCFNSGTGTFDF